MKEIDKIKCALKVSDRQALKAAQYKAQLYRDNTILEKKERELIDKYHYVPRSKNIEDLEKIKKRVAWFFVFLFFTCYFFFYPFMRFLLF